MKSAKNRQEGAETRVNVSTLKTHLGQYLKKVKQGSEVIVLDRQTPVAKLVGFNGDKNPLQETAPTLPWEKVMRQLKENDEAGNVTKLRKRSIDYLSEDRNGR